MVESRSVLMKRYLGICLAALAALTCCIIALNVAVDPYGILGTKTVSGLTTDKPAAADRPRLTKSYLVDHVRATTLLLGASNVDVGFNPLSPVWPDALRPVFNLAIDGSLPSALFRYLQHATVHSRPKLILLGLALEDSMVMPQKRLTPADQALYGFEQRLHTTSDGTPNPGYLRARIEDTVFATFSIQALTDSVLTLLRQGDHERNSQTPLGQNTGGSFIRWTKSEGAYALVMAKDREKTPQLLTWAQQPKLALGPIGDIIRLAHSVGAKIIVFIQPSYVDQLEILRQTGLTRLYQQWKTEVAQIVAAAAPPEDPVPLWDFSGYNPYTTEPLPGPGNTASVLKWFWEPVHYREALGDLMIRRMISEGGPADFGVQITPASLPAQFDRFDQDQRGWAASHPADVARIATTVETAARAVCRSDVTSCFQPPLQTTVSR